MLQGRKTLSHILKKERKEESGWIVCDNKVIRVTYETKWEALSGGWNKMCNEHHNLYTSPNVICMIKSRKTR